MIMRSILAAVLLTASFGLSQPLTREDCALLADMALVSRALAEDGLKPDQAERIMLRIYASHPTGLETIRAAVKAGQSDRSSPVDFGTRVGMSCMQGLRPTRGKMVPV